MKINCSDDEMILLGDSDFEIRINEKACKEIVDRYNEYFDDIEETECDEDSIDKMTIIKNIFSIVEKYINKHPLGKTIGGEYVSQDDRAQEDAIDLFAEIMEYYASLEV